MTTELLSTPGDASVIVDTALASAEPQHLEEGKAYSLVVPEGGRVEVVDRDLDKYRDRPRRKSGTITVHDAASFIAYHQKHALPETEIYADNVRAQLVGVLNAHLGAPGFAGWGDHRVRLDLRTTLAWQAWIGHDRKLLDQVVFAEHVEDRLPDFVNPAAADMLELAQSFHATRAVKFDSSARLKSAETQLRYHEELDAKAGRKGDMAIPDTFELGLTPFEGSSAYKVTARLRYRITDGQLRLGYILDRPEDVARSAFLDIVNQVEEHVDRTIYRGVPA